MLPRQQWGAGGSTVSKDRGPSQIGIPNDDLRTKQRPPPHTRVRKRTPIPLPAFLLSGNKPAAVPPTQQQHVSITPRTALRALPTCDSDSQTLQAEAQLACERFLGHLPEGTPPSCVFHFIMKPLPRSPVILPRVRVIGRN